MKATNENDVISKQWKKWKGKERKWRKLSGWRKMKNENGK